MVKVIKTIGVVAENRPLEKRIILQPEELRAITPLCRVLVEKDAGIGVGILDLEYEAVGCKIASREETYAADLVIRIKEPHEDEIKLMQPGSLLMSMMHLRCSPVLESDLKKQKVIGIPLENLKNPFGYRKVEAVLASGRIGMGYGFKLWGKDPSTCQVKIMGYGNMSRGALRCAARQLAGVEILNRKHFEEMEKHIPGTDILVDAVNRPFQRNVDKEPPFVTRKMLKLFKKGSVIVDLVSNPERHAPVETMRPTTMKEPFYIVDGIFHTALWGWPAMDPVYISKRYSRQVGPILEDILGNGLDNAPEYVKNAVVNFL